MICWAMLAGRPARLRLVAGRGDQACAAGATEGGDAASVDGRASDRGASTTAGAAANAGPSPRWPREARHASTSLSRYPTRPGEITYEHFEGGFGPLNVERIHEFAELLRVDPYGILAAVEICSSDFALRTAENKFMTMFYLQLQEFDERTGDAITLLDAYALLDAFREMFAKLEAEARRREALTSRRPGDGPPDGET